MGILKTGRRRFGFTLVELLVVIAVITVLAAMLMPALQKALDSARLVACMSNLKQVYLSCASYGEENKGYAYEFMGSERFNVSHHVDPHRRQLGTLIEAEVITDPGILYCPAAEVVTGWNRPQPSNVNGKSPHQLFDAKNDAICAYSTIGLAGRIYYSKRGGVWGNYNGFKLRSLPSDYGLVSDAILFAKWDSYRPNHKLKYNHVNADGAGRTWRDDGDLVYNCNPPSLSPGTASRVDTGQTMRSTEVVYEVFNNRLDTAALIP
ncbi:MAG: type II secretion system protein [Planctomycetes bacterium]|nr:type II secretion system protein [Planctomycetota bacterium]